MNVLTDNQSKVHAALVAADEPLTAYALLDRLRDDGLRAPPQIYRALDALTARGLAHRLESVNAYVACSAGCGDHGVAAFLICDECGNAQEFALGPMHDSLIERAAETGFSTNRVMVELRGRCAACQDR